VKKILIVAYFFPPIAASGAMRPLGFCRHLESYGWQPWVISTTPSAAYPPHPVDNELQRRVPPTVLVDRVSYVNPLKYVLAWRNRWLNRPRDVGFERSIKNGNGQAVSGNAGMLCYIKNLLLDWGFEFPDPQAAWFTAVIRHVLAMKTRPRPDAVLATANPWTSLLVGRALARHFDVPLLVDFRDPWSSNPYSPYRSIFLARRARRLEEAVCRDAAWVITNTEELRARMTADYPAIESKCVSLTNGYDAETLGLKHEGGASDCGHASETAAEGYELCHFGTVYGKRSPQSLLRAIQELRSEGLLAPHQIRLRFIGTWDHVGLECDELAAVLEKDGFLKRDPPVAHEECVSQMKQSSVLLVLQPDSPLQIPAKLYEYVAVGRPLLLVGGEGATANLVRRHRLGVSCPSQVAAIKNMLMQVINGALILAPPHPDDVARFDYRALTGQLAELLNACSARDAERTRSDNRYAGHHCHGS
jgi:hypothetical protein